MNKHRISVLSVLAAIFLFTLLPFNGRALARHPIASVTFGYQQDAVLDPGKVWVDEKGLHIRDRIETGLITGDLAGFARVVYNADLAFYPNLENSAAAIPDPVEGVAYGTIEMFTGDMDLIEPTWSGEWSYQVSRRSVTSGNLTAYNWREGLVLMVSSIVENRRGVLMHTGTIDHVFCPDVGCPDPVD